MALTGTERGRCVAEAAPDGLPHDLRALRRDVAADLEQRGCSFGPGRPFLVDPVPRVIEGEEWAAIAPGLEQRVRALEAFAADVYGPRRACAEGVVPERVVREMELYEPAATRLPAPRSRLVVVGLDLVRDETGALRVLEDNTRTPSGLAYALAAQEAVGALVPGLPAAERYRAALADALGGALRALAPAGAPDPLVVVLTDGPGNPACWEHRELAGMLGLPVVRPGELRVERSRLVAAVDGHERVVDVVYRRTNEEMLERAGRPTAIGELVLAPLRAGTLAVANAPGSGVADDKLVAAYVDELIRFFCGEEPLLPGVRTYDLALAEVREEALDRLAELVVKPRSAAGGVGIVLGPCATHEELDDARRRIRAHPARWIAQDFVALSTHPTVVGGELRERHVDLRPFVVHDGERAVALPGALTRVALEEGEMIVNSARGGGAKATWVGA